MATQRLHFLVILAYFRFAGSRTQSIVIYVDYSVNHGVPTYSPCYVAIGLDVVMSFYYGSRGIIYVLLYIIVIWVRVITVTS